MVYDLFIVKPWFYDLPDLFMGSLLDPLLFMVGWVPGAALQLAAGDLCFVFLVRKDVCNGLSALFVPRRLLDGSDGFRPFNHFVK